MEKAQLAALALKASENSARMSGYDPPPNGSDETYNRHRELLKDIFCCTTGVLTHPIIINMTLGNDRPAPKFRKGIRAGEAELLPHARYVRHLLNMYWRSVEYHVPRLRSASIEEREMYCWEVHNFLVSLEPFSSKNGRTARIVFYNLVVALGLPVQVIPAEKAKTYDAHTRRYRELVFAPLMRKHGYIRT